MNTKSASYLITLLIATIGSASLLALATTASPNLSPDVLAAPSSNTHAPVALQADSPISPTTPVKLIFIHHSTGGNWLADPNTNSGNDNPGGSLGQALMNNNYFVSATNYGWEVGGDAIGDRTDIPNWPEWFTDTIMSAVYIETGQHFLEYGTWPRLATDPGGENEIIMFKSCFPNSDLYGNPDDPPLSEPDDSFTVANAKAVYNHILPYFAAHQEKLFVVITAPPLMDSETAPERAVNARAFNNWLMNDWLTGYPYHNVAVFDYYNVLTSNGGDVDTNDVGAETGNHHRWWNGAVQHIQTVNNNYSAYPSGDSHPTTAGHQKATTEFVQLLNVFYNRWRSGTTASLYLTSPAGGESWTVGTQHAIQWTTSGTVTHVNLHYSTDNFGTSHEITSDVENTGSYDWTIPDAPSTTVRVRVQSTISPTTVYDVSAPFTILSTSANTYTFDAIITPTNATLPITYTWSSEHLITGQGTPQATYQLDTDGVYSITVTVENCGGMFSDTHTITIGTLLFAAVQDATVQQMVAFQDGVSPSASYSGTTDVILAGDADSNANLGGGENLETFLGDVENRRSLMRWDLSALPAGATIQGATVELYRYAGYAENDMDIALYRVTREWAEGTGHELQPGPSYVPNGATWLTATTGVAWTTPGGDYDDTILDQTTIPTDTENAWIRLDATAAVQAWVSGGQPNYGLLLRPLNGEYTYHYYHSREAVTATLRPRLVVTYTTGAPSAALNLTAPNASTHWPVSSTQQIQWNTIGSVPQVNLFYSADNFVTSSTITLSLPNTGSYGWTTPPTPTATARVRVESTISPTTVYDVSDPFHIESTEVSTSTIYLPLVLRNHPPQPPACPYPLTGVAISGPTSGPPVSTASQAPATLDRQRKNRGAAMTSQSSAFCPPLDPPSGETVTVSTVAQLQSAVNSASPGTTILVADGVYDLDGVYLRFDVPNVTLRSVSGNRENVVLDGNYATTEIVQIVASNVTIADLTLREAYDHPIHVMSTTSSDTLNTLIYNVHIIDPGQQAIKINPYTGENALYFPDNGTIACSRIELTDTGRPHIRDNCYTGGVDAHQARDWIIRDNLIEGFWCASGLSEHGIHMWRSCRDTLVERNDLRNNARGIGFGLVTSGTGIRTYPDNPCPNAGGGYVDHYGGIIRNNFVFADDAGLFTSEYGFDCGVCLWQACGAQAVHNTVASTQTPFSSIEWFLPLTDVDVINNLVTHNLRDRDGTAYLAGNLENQPLSLFADGNNGDLHLVEGATVAVDQGVALTAGLCDDDIDGDTRPSGSAPDVGADEYRVQLPTLNLIAPIGSTLWPVSSMRQILWTTSGSGSVPEINLTYSTNGFITSQTIAASLVNTGVYTWTTPPTPTTSAQVRIASTVSPTIISNTSGVFTLYNPSTFTNTLYLPLVLRNYTPLPPPCTTPLSGVTISGPISGSLVLHTFTSIVEPSDATRPITYTWSPEPANGQGTATASYQWTSSGTYTITLVATNCGGTADDVHTITIQSQASGELVQPDDLTYLGAFRLPGGEDPPLTFAYGGNAMTFNPDGDPGNSDAYPGSLFITGHDRLAYGDLPDGSQVAEVSIPVPTIAVSPTDLPQAAFVQTFHDVTAGYFTDLEEIPKIGMQYLNHPDTGPLIHLSWGQHLQPQNEPSHAWFSSTLAAPNLQGVWFIGHQNLYSTNGYMFDIPTTWADAYAQGRYLATGRMRDGGQGGMGPTLFAYRPWLAGGTPPISGTHISETVLLLYENAYNTEEITRCLTGYQHPDEWEGGAWINTPSGKSAVLFAGTKSNGTKYWYGYINPAGPEYPCVDADVTDFTTCRLADGSPCPSEDFSGCCDEGADTCVSNRGWWTTRFDAQFILYDPNDLAQVAAGGMESWKPQPYATVDVDGRLYLAPPVWDEIELGWSDQRRARLGAAAYDRENGLLYVLELYADGAKPVVHVWGID